MKMSEEILCYDQMTGEYYYTTMAKLRESQDKINRIMQEKSHLSLNDCIEFITQDMSVESKDRFRADMAEFYLEVLKEMMSDKKNYKYNGRIEKTADGQDIIVLHFDEDMKEL